MKFSQVNKKNLQVLGAILFILLVGFLLGRLSANSTEVSGVSEVREKGYKFISPLLDYQSLQETQRGQLVDLKTQIEEYIEEQTNAGNISHASVYIRELNNGPWLGIKEKQGFSPASLLKVPILISVLKQAENNPDLLNQKIKNVPINDGITQDVVPSVPLKEGQEYTVWELIEHMILYSDNRAKNLLLVSLKNPDFDRVFKDLGIQTPSLDRPEDFMSVRDYASFFRILYNASYLNKTMSNKALELLSKVEFKDGIVSGLPPGTVVSHKFGERMIGEVKQLHDCGIVYYVNNPVVLCVMTRGNEWKDLSDTIREITSISHRIISTSHTQ